MIPLLIAAAVSMTFTLLFTPLFIRLFRRLGWGQFIRNDGPQSHQSKRGTPTMGGIVFIVGAVFGYLVGHLAIPHGGFTLSAVLVIFLMVGLGLVGFVDDFIKTRKQRSLGLNGWAKVAGQVLFGSVFAVLALSFPDRNGLTPASSMISVIRDVKQLNFMAVGAVAGLIIFILWVVLIIVATSNGVNVADGLDGLATGASIVAVGAYVFIGFWEFNQNCFNPRVLTLEVTYKCYDVRDPLDLAVIAAAITGALIGFLWWNTSPAHIFMGDTGSLAIGGALAALAILTRTEVLLALIGGLFVIVTGSVILQRAYFKISHGKRIFLMSPLHHHFELKGWAEITVVVRFWIIASLFVASGVGLFYLEWSNR